MMVQFPSPYEDEILYSLIARYGIRSGNTSHMAILADVFGSENFTACLEMQPGISRIISNIPVHSTITEEQLIYQNTLYLFYTAFRSQEQAQTILNEMLGEHGRDIHNAIGLVSSSVKPHGYFQYCPLCNEEDLDKRGELYWRRLHQIPGVRICVKHGCWLNRSLVSIRGTTKYVFTAPTQANCPDYVELVIDKRMLEQYSCVVNNIERLLNKKFPNYLLERLYQCYKKQLFQKSYVSERGRVDQQRLQKDFIDFYGAELLDILQSSPVQESNWLRMMFQKHRKGFHPIRHLLTMQFLGLSLEDVFHTDESSQEMIEFEPKQKQPKRKIMKKTMTQEYKEQARNERREAWLEIREQYPDLGRLELRKLNSKVYAWLYLYDREFLMNNMPDIMPPKVVSLRYDWKKRDQETFLQVTEIVCTLKNEEGKPQRLTLKRIQEIMGRQCLMPKHLAKMPKTKAFLDGVVEDSQSFRKRRVEWAIEELKREGEPLLLNRIKIKAGVNKVKELLMDRPDATN